MYRALLISLIFSNSVYAAPVPTHLFPKKVNPIVPGLLIVWDGNPTVWVVKRVEENDIYIQCADGTGDVRKTTIDAIKETRKVSP